MHLHFPSELASSLNFTRKSAVISAEQKELRRLKNKEAYQRRKAKQKPVHLFDEHQINSNA